MGRVTGDDGMRRALLNLAALRASRAAPVCDTPDPSDSSMTVTRRQALGLAGVAVAGASPALRVMESTALGSFELVRGKNRIAFLLGGHERWVIDTRRFAGSPSLHLTQHLDLIRVELRGARYPGTDVPADFICEIRRGATGSRMRLDMAFGTFSGTTHFERWLAGLEMVRSKVRFNHLHFPLSAATSLSLNGTAESTYSPDWTFKLAGDGIGSLKGQSQSLVSDTVLITLMERGEPSLLSAASAKRTAVVLWRGSRTWQVQPVLQRTGRWQLVTAPDAFNTVQVELGEDTAGNRTRALGAEAAQGVTFHPHTGLKGVDGATFPLNLTGVRYAVAFNAAGDHTSVVARFHQQPTWLNAGGCAVEVGDSAATPPFELLAHAGATKAIQCTPAVLRVSVPVRGAIVEPASVVAGTHLAFVAKGLAKTSSPHAAQVTVSDHPENSFQRFTLINLRLSVIRPDDLLALTFEFINMKLDTSAKNKAPMMVPANRNAPSYLAVHIQGQNIAEQAFFRVLPALPLPSHYPGPGAQPDPDKGKSGEFPEGPPHIPAQSRLADESRLVFAMPTGFSSLPLTLDALLDWPQYTPSVPPTALPAGEKPPKVRHQVRPPIREPLSTETSLEIPWRLKISPNRYSSWLHAFRPVTHGGRTELWHTRLGVKIKTNATPNTPSQTFVLDEHYAYQRSDTPEGKTYKVTRDIYSGGKPVDLGQNLRTIRAVWSQDYPQAARLAENVPFRMSLTGQDRFDLVKLTTLYPAGSAPATLDVPKYDPLPVQVNRLMLTTLGAWVDVRGAWSKGYHIGVALEEWQHRGTQARDNYVRVVYKGYLFPFGHRASLVKITERKFYVQNGRNIAYLFQRMFIIVREPIKLFGTTGFHVTDGRSIDRAMPFKKVHITTKTTPDLDPPSKIDPSVGTSSTDAFWPKIGGKDFLFHLIGEDIAGQLTDFTAPLAFISVENSLAFKDVPMNKVRTLYESTSGAYPSRHTRPTHGAKVAFAPSNRLGDTTLHATDITFDAFVPPSTTQIPDDQPRFYPIVASSTVSIPAVEAMLRTGEKPQIKLSDHYLKHDLGGASNSGEVFAEILGSAGSRPKVSFGGSNSGGTGTPGVVTPNLAISALSRVMGPVGGDMVDQVAGGNVPDVGAFLQSFFDNDAKILGAVPLSSIIKLPSLTPIFKVLSLVQSIESAPDTLDGLVSQATSQLQGNLSSLSAQARATLQGQLAPLRSALATLKSPMNTLHNALTSLPSIVTDLLGDVNTIITDLSTVVTDLTTLITDLDKLVADLGAANLGALQGDATALNTAITKFPKDLKKLVDDLSNLQGMNPLPLLKHAQLPTSIDTTLTWSPHLQNSGPFKALDKFLSVTATVHIPLDGNSDPSFNIVGTLGKIGLDLANIIYVGFGGLVFKAGSGEKPDVTAGGVEVLFEGPLSFVNDLKDAIPTDGFNDPPFVDITASGVEAGFTFDLPSLGVGIFSLENISFGAKVTIPFIGSSPAQVYFNFCTREHPFLLTVSMLGGGGFFGISLGLDGLDMMEASFEFGAELSLDFGIASGSVSIMAGIYFKMEKNPHDQTILTGFVHIHGEVEVLGGIISASIDVELDLTYEKDGKDTKVMGDATLTISVHIIFFSITVSASVHREFAGSHNDPTFADQVSEPNWNQYLEAFA
ncbi:MAG: putative outer rane channel [Chloroflexi bacterium]|nr:putative outer rane channel [Chloroflexota bacterium]